MSVDLKWNIIIIGHSGVGKTSVMHRYVFDSFSEEQVATVGLENLSKNIKMDNKNIKISIQDTAGQEKYAYIFPSYYRKAQGCILMYDVTDIETFAKLPKWLTELRNQNEKTKVIIVGNKNENPRLRKVERQEVKSFADKEGLDFMECSAKTGRNVEEVFQRLLHKINDNMPHKAPIAIENVSSNDGKKLASKYRPEEDKSFSLSQPNFERQLDPEQMKKKKKTCC